MLFLCLCTTIFVIGISVDGFVEEGVKSRKFHWSEFWKFLCNLWCKWQLVVDKCSRMFTHAILEGRFEHVYLRWKICNPRDDAWLLARHCLPPCISWVRVPPEIKLQRSAWIPSPCSPYASLSECIISLILLQIKCEKNIYHDLDMLIQIV